ncbi:alpha/beta hydrolase [Streptosporangium sp. NBC_01639]|uniref:alpha/beta fold hydrolase n=1 Tax=unclassified Streptosporangium TaxID=2632669 RepID=UPI002DDB1FB0|nr:alpha/beta hydrolase [Streptosporangium sp. NBC_01756]WSC85376.1 alpha/beta hydrolase [Streptosporangium sp. NBC_01756]WTD55988.1 alpha/beta hydrolase [Streptosporangium sp. NBC_01639]
MSTVTSSDGTVIAFEKVGQGPPVVLVDGAFVYRAIDPWAPQFASLLADKYTVYTYERRGRGNSGDNSGDAAPYAIAREIEDLAAVIKEAGGSANVVGLSSGAVLALDAAASDLPITKLAVYEPPFIVDDSHPPRPDDYLAVAKEIIADGRKGDAIAHALTKTVFLPPEMVEGMRAEPFFGAMEAVGNTVAYDGEIMDGLMSGKPLPTDRWSSLSVPTLVLYGGASEQWVHNGAKALNELLPTAEVQGLEGQTHEIDASVLASVVEKYFAG